MKFKTLFTFLVMATQLSSAMAAVGEADLTPSEKALAEFEDRLSTIRYFSDEIQSGQFALPFQVQQRDQDAKEVRPSESVLEYKNAISDPFYGYQVFILVDKSKSSKSSKKRNADIRTAQTMYIYVREGDQLKLDSVHPVSTGKEPAPHTVDTREGFMRVQNAQSEYVSKKFGEAMPYSLWFESEYGTAIHETLQRRCDNLIGMRASAGCIRLCPGEAKTVFELVTKYPRSTPIVLFDKRSGLPIARGTDREISPHVDGTGAFTSAPKVIRGYPAFVRIIDGNTDEKVKELEGIVANPTMGFRQYFNSFSQNVFDGLTM